MRVSIKIPDKLVPVFEERPTQEALTAGAVLRSPRTFAKMTAVRAHMWDRAGREGIILCGRQFQNSLADSSMEEVKAAIRSEPWLAAHFDIGENLHSHQVRADQICFHRP